MSTLLFTVKCPAIYVLSLIALSFAIHLFIALSFGYQQQPNHFYPVSNNTAEILGYNLEDAEDHTSIVLAGGGDKNKLTNRIQTLSHKIAAMQRGLNRLTNQDPESDFAKRLWQKIQNFEVERASLQQTIRILDPSLIDIDKRQESSSNSHEDLTWESDGERLDCFDTSTCLVIQHVNYGR
jgi:hypothetical protein